MGFFDFLKPPIDKHFLLANIKDSLGPMTADISINGASSTKRLCTDCSKPQGGALIELSLEFVVFYTHIASRHAQSMLDKDLYEFFSELLFVASSAHCAEKIGVPSEDRTNFSLYHRAMRDSRVVEYARYSHHPPRDPDAIDGTVLVPLNSVVRRLMAIDDSPNAISFYRFFNTYLIKNFQIMNMHTWATERWK